MSQIEGIIFQAVRGAIRALPPRAFGLRTHALPSETHLDSCVRACIRLIESGELAGGEVFIGTSNLTHPSVPGVHVLPPDAASAAATAARNRPRPDGERGLLIYMNARWTPGESGLDVLVELSASDLARGFAGGADLPLLKQIADSNSRRVNARLDDASVELLARYQSAAEKHRSEASAVPLLGLLPHAKSNGLPPGALAADEFDKLQGARPEKKLREARERLKGLSSEEREQLGQNLRPRLLEGATDPVGLATRLCEEVYRVASGREQPSEKLCGLTFDLARVLRRGKEGINSLLGPQVSEGDGPGTIPPPPGEAISPWELLIESGPAGFDGDIFVQESFDARKDEPPAFSLGSGAAGARPLRGESPPGLLLSMLATHGISSYVEDGCAALVDANAGDARAAFTARTLLDATIHWRDKLEAKELSTLTSERQAAVQRFREARRKVCEAALRLVEAGSSDEDEEADDEEADRGAAEAASPDLLHLLFLLDDHALFVAQRLGPDCREYVDAYVALIDAAIPAAGNPGAEAQTEHLLGAWLVNLDIAFSARSGRVDAARLLPLHPLRLAYALCALAYGGPPPPFPSRLGVNFRRQDWLEPEGTPHVYAFIGSQSPNAFGVAAAAREGLAAAWHVVRPTGLVTALRIAFVDVDGDSVLLALEELCKHAQALYEEDSFVRDGVHLEVWRAISAQGVDAARRSDTPRGPLGPAAVECEALPRGEGVSLTLNWATAQADSVLECHLVVRAVETPYETVAAVPLKPTTLPMRYQPGANGNVALIEVADSDVLRCYDRLLDMLGVSPMRRGPNPSYPAGGTPRALVEARVAYAGWPIEPHRSPALLSYLEAQGHVIAILADREIADPMLLRRLRQIAPGIDPDVGALRQASLGLFSCRAFLQRLLDPTHDKGHLLGQFGLLRAFVETIGGTEARILALSLDSPEGRAWIAAVAQPGAPRRRADLLLLEAPLAEDPGAPGPHDVTRIRVLELKARSSAPTDGSWEALAAQALLTLASLRRCFSGDSTPAAALQRLAWMEAGRQHLASGWQAALRALEDRITNKRQPDITVECWIILDKPWAGNTEGDVQCAALDEAGQPAATGERVTVRFRVLAPQPAVVVPPPAAPPAGKVSPAMPKAGPPPGVSRQSSEAPPLAPEPSSTRPAAPPIPVLNKAQEVGSRPMRPATESAVPSEGPVIRPASGPEQTSTLGSNLSSGSVSSAPDGMRLVLGATRSGTPALWMPNRTDLVNHYNVGITGTMGTGKTQLTKSLLAQLAWQGRKNPGSKGPGILVFDYKGDYQDSNTELFASRIGAVVLQPEHLPLNPLRTMRPTTKQEFVALARVFADTMLAIQPRIGAVQRNDLVTGVVQCFGAAGISADDPSSWSRPFPTLRDLQRHLESEGRAQGAPQAVLMDLVDLGIFAEEDPPGEVDDFFDAVHVVNLKPLGSMPSVIRAVLCFFMNAFYGQMLRAGEALLVRPEGSSRQLRALRRLVFVDEADDFISLGLHSLKNVMQQGRSFGCGVVFSTQFLHHFNRSDDPLRPLIGTWVLHQMSDLNASDVKALFGLPKTEADHLVGRLSSLPKHTSLCVGLSSEDGRPLSAGQPVEVRDLPFMELSGSES